MAKKKDKHRLKREKSFWDRWGPILTFLAFLPGIYFGWKSLTIQKQEFDVKTRPNLKIVSQPFSKDISIKNWGEIAASNVYTRKKILFKWNDKEGKEQARWLRSAHGESKVSIFPGEEITCGNSIFALKEISDLLERGVRIETYTLISYDSYKHGENIFKLLLSHKQKSFYQSVKVDYIFLNPSRHIVIETAHEGTLADYSYKERFIQDDTIEICNSSNVSKILQEVEKSQ